MAKASFQFKPLTHGPGSLVVTAGEDGLALLVPGVELLSAGALPVRPALVSRLAVGTVARVVEEAAGYARTAPLETRDRARVRVEWIGLAQAERDSVCAFLLDDCQSGVLAFHVEIDGEGGEVMTVRALGPAEDVWRNMAAWDVAVECEEVL